MKVCNPRSSGEAYYRLQEGIEPGNPGWVRDALRGVRLPVTTEEWRMVELVARHGRVRSSSLAPRQLRCIASLGDEFFCRLRLSGAVEGPMSWLDVRSRLSNYLAPQRVVAANSIWMPLRLMWWTAVALRRLGYITVGLAALVSVSLDIPASVVVAVLVVTAVIFWSVGIHELAHLLALRITQKDPELGGVWRGRSGIAIVRPRLSGTQLRWVAAAGPLAGCLAALVLLPLRHDIAGVGLAVPVSLAFNALGMFPVTSDGQALWFGRET